MVCPFCLHNKTVVYNSRQSKKTNGTWRRRRCEKCQQQFTTYENIDVATVLKVLRGKKSIPFSPATLMVSLIKALDHRDLNNKEVVYLYGAIEQQLIAQAVATQQIILPQDIAQATAIVLKRYDAAAYVKYMSYHHKALDAAAIRKAFK